jgi:polar amino acid transport system ATP-binding protein
MTMPVLEMRNLRKSFGDKVVLDDVSLSVASHEVVCLIGASGSGKSTLLRCCNLLEPANGGSISLFGVDLSGPEVRGELVRRQVGIVFQSFNLFPHRSVLDNITMGPRRALKVPRANAERTARKLLERFSLSEKANDFPDRLSGGQQQRVAIIRALAMDPKLLLLDEITSALDPALVAEVLDVVRELARSGMPMLLATHEIEFARDVATTVVFLENGSIVEAGPPHQVLADPRDERTATFLRRYLEGDVRSG